MATTKMDTTTSGTAKEMIIQGEIVKGTNRKENPESSQGSSKERNIDNWLDIIEDGALISELGGETMFIVYCLDEFELDPDEFAIRPLALLIQHLLNCAKTPAAFLANSKIQPRLVNGKQSKPTLRGKSHGQLCCQIQEPRRSHAREHQRTNQETAVRMWPFVGSRQFAR